MIEIDLILTLSLVTFGLVSVWMYQTKLEAEEGLLTRQSSNEDSRQDNK